jgi:hypothetical protein
MDPSKPEFMFDSYGPEYKDNMVRRWKEFSQGMTGPQKEEILAKFLSFLQYGFKDTEFYWWSREAMWFLKRHDPEIGIFFLAEWHHESDEVSDQMRSLFEIVGHPNLLVSGVQNA